MNIRRAIDYLIRHHGLKVPHEIIPGRFPGGLGGEFTETLWNADPWNPVRGSEHRGRDDGASDKPTWTALVIANTNALLEEGKDEVLRFIHEETTYRRIPAAYGQETLEDETLFRLANRQTADQDAERVRLQGVAKALKAKVAAATTLAELRKIAPEADATWAPPPAS